MHFYEEQDGNITFENNIFSCIAIACPNDGPMGGGKVRLGRGRHFRANKLKDRETRELDRGKEVTRKAEK